MTNEDFWGYLIATFVVAGIGMGISNKVLLEEKIEEIKPKIQEAQVLGNETPERFYEIDGQRVYLTIDGKPIEQYFAEGGK